MLLSDEKCLEILNKYGIAIKTNINNLEDKKYLNSTSSNNELDRRL